MKTYELTYIIGSGITTDEVTALVKEVAAFIQSKEGVILKSDKTIATTLAYPIKKQSSGYFITETFQADEKIIKEVKAMLERTKEVLRSFILVKLPVKEVKQRRSKRPMPAPESMPAKNLPETKGKKAEKLNAEDLDKKLDEILS